MQYASRNAHPPGLDLMLRRPGAEERESDQQGGENLRGGATTITPDCPYVNCKYP